MLDTMGKVTEAPQNEDKEQLSINPNSNLKFSVEEMPSIDSKGKILVSILIIL